ncbi:MAG: cupredoxin domain-containing protein [Sandaracinaceae bacterium]|nr:cupredoxin domain-containing protein [Myxococcales bacterium]
MKHTLMAIALLSLSACFLSACGGEEASSADGRVHIEVNASGYEPAQVQATAGQPLTLVFTRTTDEGCGQELAIPAHDIRRRLPLDEPVEVTITPTEAGELRFTCGMDMYDGAIVVR